MSNDKYIEPDEKHSALIIIDVQKDFTLKMLLQKYPERYR